jgi:hypothetical protein
MNPRTLSFFPPSSIAMKHLYVLPLYGSSTLPPDHCSPSFRRSQSIRSPITGLSFISPSQCAHRGSGYSGSGSMSFSILPFSLPFSSQMTTTDFTLFVASSTVLHRPTGANRDEVCADDSIAEKNRHTTSVDRMKSSILISANSRTMSCKAPYKTDLLSFIYLPDKQQPASTSSAYPGSIVTTNDVRVLNSYYLRLELVDSAPIRQ